MFASAWYRDQHFGSCVQALDNSDLKDKKALILWGGEDISPWLYGQKPVKAHAGDSPSHRDQCEVRLVQEAVRLGIPIIGICRGAQLLCAIDGGTLWQHVNNHAGIQHPILVKNTIIGYTNSFHHQMMRPAAGNEILGISHGSLSKYKWADDLDPVESDEEEVEIVYFPRLNALGIQGHPEWLKKDAFLNRISKELIQEKLGISVFED